MHDTAIIRPSLDVIFEHRDAFPLAYLIAQQLRPVLAQVSQELTGHAEKSHVAALARSDVIPDKLMDAVTRTMEQLQQQIFALSNRQSPFEPEAKNQLKAAKEVAAALNETVASILQANAATHSHGNGHAPARGAA